MFTFFRRRKGKLFGEIAVEKGLASQKDIDEALEIQEEYEKKHKTHKLIGAILTEKEVLTPQDVKGILEEQNGQISVLAWFVELFQLSR